jgi:hypothetical protein
MNVQTIDKFHKTRLGYLVFGLVELGISYLLANAALGSGDWWEWLLAFVFLFGFLQNSGRMLVVHKK